MATHNQILDTIDESITSGVKKSILHLHLDDFKVNGRELKIKGQSLINFSSYSYMGLETDPRLIQGGIEAFEKYGTQFGASRAYLSSYLYEELEENMSRIFGRPTLIAPSTTLAHQAAIPVLVRDNDAVLLDQYVHASVQVTTKMVKTKGVPVELIRHNNLEKLEERIKELSAKYRKVWYMLDGVYSMYGDFAPLKGLKELMDKYPKFHCYVDDAHGMSWIGKNGRGYTLSEIDHHPQMILVTCLSKSFASAGGAIVLPDQETRRKVRTCGETMIFVGSVPPAMLGVGVASSKIHLSNEIEVYQKDLKSKIEYCNYLIKKNDLPLVSDCNSPIFFVGMSLPKIAHEMSRRLKNDGFYVSVGQFPAVSMRCAGLRICISRHQQIEDIENLVETIEKHYPQVLHEEEKTNNQIRRAFKLSPNDAWKKSELKEEKDALRIEYYTSIKAINKDLWDAIYSDRGSFDYDGLVFLEDTFSNNQESHNNWDFHYILVKKSSKIIASTFLTNTLSKDDMFAPYGVSQDIEKVRKIDPSYMCSKVTMMGSMLTEGEHLFVDKEDEDGQKALSLILARINSIYDLAKSTSLILRDFEDVDEKVKETFLGDGYIKLDLPEANILEKEMLDWEKEEDFVPRLSYKNRKNFRRDVLKYEEFYNINIVDEAFDKQIDYWTWLYNQVKRKSFELNTFDLPRKFFVNALKSSSWEVMELSLKKEFADTPTNRPIAVVFSFKNDKVLVPMVLGLDYKYLYSYKNYKQVIYQLVKRANVHEAEKLYLGFTANVEKRKFGAKQKPKVAFLQTKDGFNMQVLELNKTTSKSKEEFVMESKYEQKQEEILA